MHINSLWQPDTDNLLLIETLTQELIAMAWIFAGFVLLLFVAIPGFRNTILILIGVVVIGGGLLLYSNNKEEQRLDKLERSLISPKDLRITNLLLTESQGSWYLKGRVENDSASPLKEFSIKMSFQDCDPNSKEDCKIYGENTVKVRLHIPPRQVRDLSEYVTQPTTKPKGRSSWSYQIVDIKGQASTK